MKNIFKFNFSLFTFAGTETGTAGYQTSTDSGIANEFKTYYDKRIIRLVGPNLVYAQFAVKKPLPAGSGKSIEFRGFKDLDSNVATHKLTEGQTPDAQKLEEYHIVATIAQYGGYVGITDMVKTHAIDPMVNEAIDKLSAQAEKILDKLIRNTIVSDAEVHDVLAGNVSSESELTVANGKMTVAEIRRIVNILKRNDAPRIDGAYPLIVHPDVSTDLQADPEYKELYHYLKPEKLAAGYVGDVAGARIYESTNALITKNATSNVAIYHCTLIAQGAYATVDVAGGGLETFIKQLGSSGSSDPINQRGSVGYKVSTANKVLIPKYLVDFSCTSSTNATEDAETVVSA